MATKTKAEARSQTIQAPAKMQVLSSVALLLCGFAALHDCFFLCLETRSRRNGNSRRPGTGGILAPWGKGDG